MTLMVKICNEQDKVEKPTFIAVCNESLDNEDSEMVPKINDINNDYNVVMDE